MAVDLVVKQFKLGPLPSNFLNAISHSVAISINKVQGTIDSEI